MSEVKTHEEVGKVVEELRALVETKSKESGEYKEKFEKLSVAFENAEKNQNELSIKLINQIDAEKQLNKKVEELETKFYRPAGNGNFEVQSEGYKSFMDAMRTGDKLQASLKFAEANKLISAGYATDAKAMRTDDNIAGGFLCPPEWDKQIVKKIVETSPMRQLCRVTTIGSKSIMIPVRNTLATAYFEGEEEESAESNSQYGNIEIVTNALTAEHHITYEMLNSGYYDMEAEMTSDTALQYARAEGYYFLQGTGVKTPAGLMNNSLIATRYTTDAAGITFDSIKLLIGDLKVGYNPSFILNRRTIAYLSTLKNSIGAYLWQEGNSGAGVPATLCGLPYVSVIDMDDIGSNKYPIVIGDFKEGYRVVDRFGMYVVRDEVTSANKRIIKFFFHKYVGGDVVKAEAFKKLQCHA